MKTKNIDFLLEKAGFGLLWAAGPLFASDLPGPAWYKAGLAIFCLAIAKTVTAADRHRHYLWD